MIRPILFLTVGAAGLALAACDQPSALKTAKTGDCLKVVGQDSLGAPKLESSACAVDGTSADETANTEDGAQSAAATDGSQAPACVEPKAAEALLAACRQLETGHGASAQSAASGAPAYIATSKVRARVRAGTSSRRRTHGAAARTVTTRNEREERVTQYQRIDSDAYYASLGRRYSSDQGGYRQDYRGYGQGYEGGYRRQPAPPPVQYAPPPRQYAPPPPVQYTPPPPAPVERSYGGYSVDTQVSGSSSYSVQGSSSSSSYGSGYAYAEPAPVIVPPPAPQPECPCPGAQRGPHQPFDDRGFLTWPGKVQYRP